MFLKLPPHVRRSVYEIAGVMIDEKIHLLRRATGNKQTSEWREQHYGPDLHVLNLLLVCKVVHDEVLTLILSRNNLIIGPEPASITFGFRFISNLTPRHCFHVTNLHVYLQRFRTSQDYRPEDLPAYPIKDPLKNEVVDVWKQAARHLLAFVKPKNLRLRLICDSNVPPYVSEADRDDGSLMIEALRPLLEFPGKLAELELRLAARRDHALSVLAEQTARHATGQQPLGPNQRTFPFLELPQEIRRQVLEYTDLVMPLKQVQWDSQNGYRCQFIAQHCLGHYIYTTEGSSFQYAQGGPIRWHRGCSSHLCDHNPLQPGDYQGDYFCFLSECCRARHSAYRAQCQCWMPPDYLMLVSRAVHHDAQAVFFASNRISVCPSPAVILSENPMAHLRSLRLDASKFITMHTWSNPTLRNISHLELVVMPFEEPLYYKMRPETLLDWSFAVQHVSRHANANKLTMSLFLSRTPPLMMPRPGGDSPYSEPLSITLMAYDLWLLSTYERFVEPLRSLRPMKRSFVYLEASWPDSWLRYGGKGRQILNAESRLERFVMGPDYNSAAVGKSVVEAAHWRQVLWPAAEFWSFDHM